MSQTDAPAETALQDVSPSATETRLQGRWLTLARTTCIGTMVLFLGVSVAALPIYFARLHTLCSSPSCSNGQLPPAALQALQTLGFSLDGYAVFTLMLILISTLASVAVATILLWRVSDNWMALLVALMLIAQGTSTFVGDHVLLRPMLGPTFADAFGNLLNFVDVLGLLGVSYLFPNGRFVPRWTRWLLLFVVVLDVFFSFVLPHFVSPSSIDVSSWFYLLGYALWASLLLSGVVAQLYRYRRVSTPVERQQTKWVVSSFAFWFLLTGLGVILPGFIFPPLGQPDSLYNIVGTLFSNLGFILFMALSFGIAILRYRLYDIDVLIHRTLIYSTLTAILALLYVGLVIGLGSLVRLFTGQLSQSPVVIVASTLAIAALFQPLRHRIQAIIDRRFYRSKYDAARTLAAFSATLRSEVDLDQLREHLLAIVEETMQPAHISLWLRPPDHGGKHRAPWKVNPSVHSKDG
jgi:hypothetical protein